MDDKAVDPEQLYNSDYREGFGEGKSWEDLGNTLRTVMDEIAKRETIQRRLESLTSLEFDREADESHAETMRIGGAFEQLESECRQLDKDLAAAKQKYEAESECVNKKIRELHGELRVAKRKHEVIKRMKGEGEGEDWT